MKVGGGEGRGGGVLKKGGFVEGRLEECCRRVKEGRRNIEGRVLEEGAE